MNPGHGHPSSRPKTTFAKQHKRFGVRWLLSPTWVSLGSLDQPHGEAWGSSFHLLWTPAGGISDPGQIVICKCSSQLRSFYMFYTRGGDACGLLVILCDTVIDCWLYSVALVVNYAITGSGNRQDKIRNHRKKQREGCWTTFFCLAPPRHTAINQQRETLLL